MTAARFPLRLLSPADRLAAFAARGIMLYLNPTGDLRATCEPESALVLAAAVPSLKHHKPGLVAALQRMARDRPHRSPKDC